MSQEKGRSKVIDLPSKGLLYQGQMPEGQVEIKPLSTKGEKVLADSKSIAEVQSEYFQRYLILPEGMSHLDLLIGDRTYIFFMIRAMSYGPFYDFEFRCDQCGKKTATAINIEELPVKSLPEDAMEPFSVTLPDSGDVVTFHLLRGHDELAAMNWMKKFQQGNANPRQQQDSEVNSKVFELARIIETVNGKPFADSGIKRVGPTFAQAYVENLLPWDSSTLQQALEDLDPGLDLKALVSCSNRLCKAENEVQLGIDRDFFRASRNTRNAHS